ncbi:MULTISPECIES: DUF6086 family protein [Nocardia]|uniref:DUF6086 family protein n=1 Tax=Nocardia TaxID=1817 RepID=UPI0006F9D28F|nr:MULTISPECIES: DUF6086 family protein [Nocardia]KQY36371.1 hypothetical protein ASD42_31700 [Nocardia sp. Root136]
MSQYYELDGTTLWNPSNGASRLFLNQVGFFEEELGVSSGIGPMESDACEVTPVVLEVFLATVLAWRGRTGNAVVQALSDGFLATLLVIAERAGITMSWAALADGGTGGMQDVQVRSSPLSGDGGEFEWSATVREHARQLDSFMAR